jgi:phosphatidylinositol-bisphosphatase
MANRCLICSARLLAQEWAALIQQSLPTSASYVKLKSRQLVGMLIIVYIRQSWEPHVKRLHSDVVGCGVMGLLGNKGGVAVSLTVHDTDMCFVSSHLAAHDDAVARRNQVSIGPCSQRTRGPP